MKLLIRLGMVLSVLFMLSVAVVFHGAYKSSCGFNVWMSSKFFGNFYISSELDDDKISTIKSAIKNQSSFYETITSITSGTETLSSCPIEIRTCSLWDKKKFIYEGHMDGNLFIIDKSYADRIFYRGKPLGSER